MKTKFTTKKVNFKIILGVLIAGLITTIPIRFYQLFKIIEPHTGFYSKIDWSIYTIYTLIIAFSITLFLLVRFSQSVPASKPICVKSKPLGIGAIIFAVGIAYDLVMTISSFVRELINKPNNINVFKYVFKNGMFASIILAICGLAACIYILVFALSYFEGKTTFREYRLLAMMPLFWSMGRMITRFMTKISFVMVSELLMELLMIAFMMLFFMAFARVSAQIGQKGEMRKLMSYGLPAAFVAILIGVTRLVMTLIGKGKFIADGFQFSLADLGFGIFAIIYIIETVKHGRPASEDDLIPEEDDAIKKENEIDDEFLTEE
ncbi:MAG: hypothetical protein RR914_00520 [Oscillospiraceae bacterium]